MTHTDDLARLVADLPNHVPRGELAQLRADLPRPRRETVDDLVREAVVARPDPALERLLSSYHRDEATASMVLAHPAVRAVVRRRTADLLGD